jgi:hypothetical protein
VRLQQPERLISFAVLSAATDILNDWDTVKLPPKPELKQVTLDPSTIHGGPIVVSALSGNKRQE